MNKREFSHVSRPTLMFVLLMVPMFMAAIAPTFAVATTTNTNPASSRELTYNVEVYAKYTYNGSAISSVRDGIKPGIQHGSYLIPMSIVQDNQTLDAVFTHNRGYLPDANLGDLNISGGTEYSNDIFGDVGTLPKDYVFPSTSRANFQSIGNIPETDLVNFDTQQPMQYFIRESPKLDDVENDIASSLDRTWTKDNVTITSVDVILTFKWDALASLFASMEANDKWDTSDPMSDGQLVSVLNDALPAYTYGLHLGQVNITALQAETGKSNWEGTDEVVATLDNKTDTTLTDFGNSWHMTNAMISYFGENQEAIQAAINNHNFGKPLAPSRGPFHNLVATGTAADGSGTVAVSFSPSGVFATGGDMNAGDALTFVEALNAKFVKAYASIPYFGIFVTALFIYMLIVALRGQFKPDEIANEFKSGKKWDYAKILTNVIIFGIVVYAIYAVAS